MPVGDPDVIFEYDRATLLMAYGVSVLGALTGIGIMEQRRLSRNAVNKRVLEVVSACSLGGCSLWGMHVMCTLAIRLINPLTLEEYPVQILWGWLFLALVIPIVFVALAIELASRDKFFGKSVHERVEMMAKDMRGLSMSKMRGGGRQLIMLRALLSSPWRLLGAGCLMGIGTFFMQYLIVGAMKVNCERLTRYPMFALAAWVSLSVCIIFIWTLFRLLTWKPKLEWLRITCAFGFGAIAMSIHFVTVKSMDWMVFVHQETPLHVEENRITVALRVCPAVLVWCCICFVLIISDLRHGFIDYKADVDKIFKLLKPILADARERGVLSTGPANADRGQSMAPGKSPLSPRTDAARLESLLLDVAGILSRHATAPEDRSLHSSRSASQSNKSTAPSMFSRQRTVRPSLLPSTNNSMQGGGFHQGSSRQSLFQAANALAEAGFGNNSGNSSDSGGGGSARRSIAITLPSTSEEEDDQLKPPVMTSGSAKGLLVRGGSIRNSNNSNPQLSSAPDPQAPPPFNSSLNTSLPSATTGTHTPPRASVAAVPPLNPSPHNSISASPNASYNAPPNAPHNTSQNTSHNASSSTAALGGSHRASALAPPGPQGRPSSALPSPQQAQQAQQAQQTHGLSTSQRPSVHSPAASPNPVLSGSLRPSNPAMSSSHRASGIATTQQPALSASHRTSVASQRALPGPAPGASSITSPLHASAVSSQQSQAQRPSTASNASNGGAMGGEAQVGPGQMGQGNKSPNQRGSLKLEPLARGNSNGDTHDKPPHA